MKNALRVASICVILLFFFSSVATSNQYVNVGSQSPSQASTTSNHKVATNLASGRAANQKSLSSSSRRTPNPASPALLGGTDPTSPWPMYKNNPQLTGVSSYLGASTSGQKWSYAAASTILGSNTIPVSIAMSPDGSTIYSEVDSITFNLPSNLTAISATTGKDIWNFTPASGTGITTAPAVGSDGTIYAGGQFCVPSSNPCVLENGLFAVSPSGAQDWFVPLASSEGFSTPPVIASNGDVYLFDNRGILFSITPTTQTANWSYNANYEESCSGFSPISSPALSPDGSTVYIPSIEFTGTASCLNEEDGYLYAISASSGTLLWRFDIGICGNRCPGYSSPIVGPDGTIYLSDNEGGLTAITPPPQGSQTASMKWQALLGNSGSGTPSLSSSGDAVYVGGFSCLSALKTTDGSSLWESCPPQGSYESFGYYGGSGSSPAVGSDGTIYVGSDEPALSGQTNRIEGVYALSPSGTEKWFFQMPDAVDGSPTIGSDGTIYVVDGSFRPSVSCGCSSIYAIGGPSSASVSITSLNITQGALFTYNPVSIAGSGFTNAVLVQFGSTYVQSCASTFNSEPCFTIDSDTKIELQTPYVSSYQVVPVSVIASSSTGSIGSNSLSFQFGSAPAIGLSLSQGPVGTNLVVTGSNFSPFLSTINVYYDGSLITTTSTSSGSSFTAFLTVPAGIAGSHAVSVTDTAGDCSQTGAICTQTFTVQPSILVTPASGILGSPTTVTISGSGFAASSSIAIDLDGTPITMTPATVTTDSTGSFSGVSITIPSSESVGAHPIAAKDASGDSVSSSFIVNNFFTSTVSGTCCLPNAVGLGGERKLLVASGLWWGFWSQGSAIMYSHSADGVTWSTPTTLTSSASSSPSDFSAWLSGTDTIYYVLAIQGSNSFVYRFGTLNPDGSITWSIAETSVTTTYPTGQAASIITDGSGSIWVAVSSIDSKSNIYLELWEHTTSWNQVDLINGTKLYGYSQDLSLSMVPLGSDVGLLFSSNSEIEIMTISGGVISSPVSTSQQFQDFSATSIGNTIYVSGAQQIVPYTGNGYYNAAVFSYREGDTSTSPLTTLYTSFSLAPPTSIAVVSGTSLVVFYGTPDTLNYASSTDGGLTWSVPQTIVGQITSLGDISAEFFSSTQTTGALYAAYQSGLSDIDFVELNLVPSNFVTVSITLTPVTGSNPISGTNYFTITYFQNGQQVSAQHTGGTLALSVDPSSQITISGTSSQSSSSEEWCISDSSSSPGSNCAQVVINAPASGTLSSSYVYYDLLQQAVSFSIVDGGSPSGPKLSYGTVSSTAGSSATPQNVQLTLTTSPQDIWVLRGLASISYPGILSPSSSEQWTYIGYGLAPTDIFGNIQCCFAGSESPNTLGPIVYYNQYSESVSFTTQGGTYTGSSPNIDFIFLGQTENCVVGVTNASWNCSTMFVDAGSAWSMTNPLPGSVTQDWQSSDATGTISASGQIAPLYVLVSLLSTATAFTCTSPDLVETSTTCTAVVTISGSTPPSAAVTFSPTSPSDGSFSPATCDLTLVGGNYQCSVSYTPTQGGAQILTATYEGDTTNTQSSGTFTLNVLTRTTQIQVGNCPSIAVTGKSYDCTVTVTDNNAGTPIIPSGSATLQSSLGSTFGVCNLVPLLGSADAATCTTSYLPAAGSLGNDIDVISASYSGDTAHSGSVTGAGEQTTVTIVGSGVQVTLTLNQFVDSISGPSGTPLSISNAFIISYTLGGSPQTISETGGTITFFADPNTVATIPPTSSGSNLAEQWCLYVSYPSLVCQPTTISVGTASVSETFVYFDLQALVVLYKVTGGTLPQPPFFTYSTAWIAPTSSSIVFEAQLSQVPQVGGSGNGEIWALAGTVGSFDSVILGSSIERWVGVPSCNAIFGSMISGCGNYVSNNQVGPFSHGAIGIVLTYYYQWDMDVLYSTSDGSNAFTAPTLTYFSGGAQSTVQLTNNANNIPTLWMDYGSSWSASNTIAGSSSGEQWVCTDSCTGSVPSSLDVIVEPSYTHQYSVTFGSIDYWNCPDPYAGPNICSNSVGTTSPQGPTWVDAGTTVQATATPPTGSGVFCANVPTSSSNPSGVGPSWTTNNPTAITLPTNCNTVSGISRVSITVNGAGTVTATFCVNGECPPPNTAAPSGCPYGLGYDPNNHQYGCACPSNSIGNPFWPSCVCTYICFGSVGLGFTPDPAYVLITAPDGISQVGCDQNGNVIDTITGATVTPCAGGLATIWIGDPVAGVYGIQIFPVGSSSSYVITVSTKDIGGNTIATETLTGTVSSSSPVDTTLTLGSTGSLLGVSSVSTPPPSLVEGNITWTTPTYQGMQYIFPVSVAINGEQFSAVFDEALIAQDQLIPGEPYAGYYSGTFGAISGCQPGANITITATVGGVAKSESGLCPGVGNTTSISFNFITPGGTSAVQGSLVLPWVSWISSMQSSILPTFLAFSILSWKIRPRRRSLFVLNRGLP